MLSRLLLALALAVPVMAQSTPKLEVGTSVNMMMPNFHFQDRQASVGGDIQVVINTSDRLSVVADFGIGQKVSFKGFKNIPGPDASIVTFLGGPRLNFRNQSRVTPYAQGLAGMSHASASVPEAFNEFVANGIKARVFNLPDGNTFSLLVGGGFDIAVNRSIAIKVAEVGWLHTGFGPTSQNNLRILSGVVFRF